MAVNVGTAVAYLDIDMIKFREGLKTALSETDTFSNAVSQKFADLGSNLQLAGGVLTDNISKPIINIGKNAVDASMNFEQSMSKVGAISGATGVEMESLKDKALEMGAKTKFSAKESADAFTYMAMAGWETEDMLAGISGIMNLAAADGLDLATTSDIVTDALTAFGLSADEAGEFADVLAATSSSANTNVSMLGESFKYVAPVAGAMGYNIYEVAHTLGLMANSGIKASSAGTALRGAITRLTKPTDEMKNVMLDLGLATTDYYNEIDSAKVQNATTKVQNKTIDLEKAQSKYNEAVSKYGPESTQAQKAMIGLEKAQNNLSQAQHDLQEAQAGTRKEGEFLNSLMADQDGNATRLNQVIVKLRSVFKNLTEEEQAQAAATLFGQEAMAGMLAVINASGDDFDKLSDAIDGSRGTAEQMSDTMQDNLAGSLTYLNSALEGVYIKLGDALAPVIRDIADWITKFLEWLNTLDETTVQWIATIGAIVAAIGPVLTFLGKISSGIGLIIDVAGKLSGVMGGVLGIGGKLLGGMKTIFGLVPKLIGAIAGINPVVLIVIGAITALIAIGVALYKNWDTVKEMAKNAWDAITGFVKNAAEAIGNFLRNLFDTAVNVVKNIKDSFFEVVKNIKEYVADLVKNITDKVAEIAQKVANSIREMHDKISDFVKKIYNYVSDIAKKVVDAIVNIAKKVGEFISNTLKGIYNFAKKIVDYISDMVGKIGDFVKKIPGFFKDIVTAIPDMIKKMGEFVKNIFKGILDFVKSLIPGFSSAGEQAGSGFFDNISKFFNMVKDAVKGVFDFVKNIASGIGGFFSGITGAASSYAGSHANGLDYVPYDGYIAQLHQGERVLTKKEAQQYDDGGTGGGVVYNIRFQSPEAIDEYQAARLLKQTIKELDL